MGKQPGHKPGFKVDELREAECAVAQEYSTACAAIDRLPFDRDPISAILRFASIHSRMAEVDPQFASDAGERVTVIVAWVESLAGKIEGNFNARACDELHECLDQLVAVNGSGLEQISLAARRVRRVTRVRRALRAENSTAIADALTRRNHERIGYPEQQAIHQQRVTTIIIETVMYAMELRNAEPSKEERANAVVAMVRAQLEGAQQRNRGQSDEELAVMVTDELTRHLRQHVADVSAWQAYIDQAVMLMPEALQEYFREQMDT